MISPDDLRQIMPAARGAADLYYQPLSAAADRFDISTPARLAAFLAQVAEESAQLNRISENLNYRAASLAALFPRHFDAASAAAVEHQPERIANILYAGRMGNGDESSGDGWLYRGRGLIQITGRDNYGACGDALGLPLLDQPDLLLQPDGAAMSAAWYWGSHHLNDLADAGDFVGITRKINGGTFGEGDRESFWNAAKQVLGA